MKNILLILVGGTICSATDQNGVISVNDTAASMLKKHFENGNSRFAKSVHIKETENMHILSENITVDTWNEILQTYLKYISNENYDGVIFAHGTDTLGYSAALFSLLLSKTDIPIFFVSANKPLEDKNSNGYENFTAAVELICMGITPNVYVTYQNISDNTMYLHLAAHLTQCGSYSEDFYSKTAAVVTCQSVDCLLQHLEKAYPPKNRKSIITNLGDFTLKNNVLLVNGYVGINYSAYNLDGFSAVLHTAYHSGTVCVEAKGDNSFLHFVKMCNEQQIPLCITPSKTNGNTYHSLAELKNSAVGKNTVNYLYGTTTEMAYAKLLIATSLTNNNEQIKSILETTHNFENI